MTNRRDYHKRTAKDVRADGRYVRLTEFMLASPAWQALDGNCRSLYIELARRYRGPNSNNGKIPYSVREAAQALNIGRSTAQRCFEQLTALGFVKIGKRSGFSMKGRVATEWLLTEFPDDSRSTIGIASKDFMRWTPPNSFHSPATDTHSPTTEPGVDLTRDRVANEQRLWP
jgi:DNA-binding transcriptional MocR family regulator